MGEKFSIRKIRYYIALILFGVLIVGYYSIFYVRENSKFIFKVDPKSDLKNLNVNLYTYKYSSGSKWYVLVKKETVIKEGHPINSFNYRGLDYHFIEVFLDDQKKEMLNDHVYKKANYEFNYYFSSEGISSNLKVKNSDYAVDNHNFRKYLVLNPSKNLRFAYYDPTTAKFEPKQLNDSSLNELKMMSFEALKNTDKILEKDILKLSQLSMGQRKKLIEIHKTKKFII